MAPQSSQVPPWPNTAPLQVPPDAVQMPPTQQPVPQSEPGQHGSPAAPHEEQLAAAPAPRHTVDGSVQVRLAQQMSPVVPHTRQAPAWQIDELALQVLPGQQASPSCPHVVAVPVPVLVAVLVAVAVAVAV